MKYEKIAPGLMSLLEDFHSEGAKGLVPHMRALGVVSAENSPKPPRAVVFIHCEQNAKFDHLSTHGIRVNQAVGKVRTAFLPLEALDLFSEDSAVQRIIPARYLRPLMDVASGKVHVPAFRSRAGLSGSNVVIGIVDTGIDSNHPAFAGRILRIWDQTLHGAGVPEGGYGVELTGTHLSISQDTHGHGTHVAGMAGGHDPTYGGIAPQAEFVVVKTDFQNAHIADGVQYIFRVARELGRAAVVNLSLGGHADAHDGSDGLSRIIDTESGQGRIVCCAAGNEGNDNIHAQGIIPAGATRTIRFKVPAGIIGSAWLNGWYPGTTPFEISLRTPGGFVTPVQGVISSGSPQKSYTLSDARIRVATPGPDPTNGDHNFFVQLLGASAGTVVTGGIWRLTVRNTSATDARLDVWTLDNQGGSEVVFTGASVQDSMKIGSPGAAASAVTVASYTTKIQWTDSGGAVQSVGMALDDISDFSSEGPLRDTSQKPDVSAPGAMIVSALSSASSPAPAWVVNNDFRVMAGTSMATPFITGMIALLLERDATLDPPGIKSLLRANSSIPNQPAGTFDPKWGWGLVDASGL